MAGYYCMSYSPWLLQYSWYSEMHFKRDKPQTQARVVSGALYCTVAALYILDPTPALLNGRGVVESYLPGELCKITAYYCTPYNPWLKVFKAFRAAFQISIETSHRSKLAWCLARCVYSTCNCSPLSVCWNGRGIRVESSLGDEL